MTKADRLYLARLPVTSELDRGFPYDSGLVTYVAVDADGVVSMPRYAPERHAAAVALLRGEAQVLAIWPTSWRAELFVVNDADAFFAAYPHNRAT